MSHPILHETRGYHHGQMDCSLLIKEQEQVIAYLDYSAFEGTPHIQMIKVAKNHRRRGHATRLLADLQSRFPDQEINWGSLTPQGTALKAALPVRQIDTPDTRDFNRLKRLEIRLKKMADEISSLYKAGQCQRAAMTAYYCLEAKVQDLSEGLWNKQPSAEILDISTR